MAFSRPDANHHGPFAGERFAATTYRCIERTADPIWVTRRYDVGEERLPERWLKCLSPERSWEDAGGGLDKDSIGRMGGLVASRADENERSGRGCPGNQGNARLGGF